MHLMATLNTDRRRTERGQAIVELALTLPLLLLVVLGIFDFGLMFQRFEIVTNAAREGARVAVLPDYTDPHQAEVHAENYLALQRSSWHHRGEYGDASSRLVSQDVFASAFSPGRRHSGTASPARRQCSWWS